MHIGIASSRNANQPFPVNYGLDLALFRWVPVMCLNNRDDMASNEDEKAAVIAGVGTPIYEPFRSSICYRHKKVIE